MLYNTVRHTANNHRMVERPADSSQQKPFQLAFWLMLGRDVDHQARVAQVLP